MAHCGTIPACFTKQDVAGHQMGTRDPRKLVIGEIPGLHTEDHPHRAALHVGFANGWIEFCGRKEALGVLGVIGENSGTELHLSASLADPLAHLQRHDARELIGPFMQDRRRFGQDGCPFGIRLVAPSFEASLGGRDLGLEFLVREFLERFQCLAVIGIDALVCHGLVLFKCHRAEAARCRRVGR